MKIKQTNLNLVYPKINDFRKKFVLAEDVLSQNFMTPTILPIPNELQGEIPRIVVQTKNSHSVLNIALTVASFTTNYDDEFGGDWTKCKEYLEGRCTDVYQIINQMTDNNIFVGLITNIEIDENDKPGIEILKSSLLNTNKIDDVFDLSCKYTFIYNSRFYVNIILENSREYNARKLDNGRVVINSEKKHDISVTIDINDRYASNFLEDYVSSKEAFDEIIKITDLIINEKLDDLIKKGEFKLC